MKNNYDHIAGMYDVLSRMVFFKAQVRAQVRQLAFIPPGAAILIVGGGTGWILEEIAQRWAEGLTITYVEISEKMLAKAKKRNVGHNRVHFIQQAIEEMPNDKQRFDVVMTAFLFDNFGPERASHVFRLLHQQLKDGGLWFFSDFHIGPVKGAYWKKLLLNLMYTFFHWLCEVEASKLQDMSVFFGTYKYREIDHSWHYFKFIKGVIYQKWTEKENR